MIFLAPAAAVVGAALAVPALLALYLLKLRRRPVRVGSILFWPAAERDVQANVPLRWVRPSWLLLLHLLILGCLLAAMGRPALSDGGDAAARTVLLIDASASMLAADAGPAGGEAVTRLERAKARAIEVVDGLRRGAGPREIAVVAVAGGARAVSNFTSSRSAVVDAIGSIYGTDAPGDLGAALRLVDAMTAEGEEDAEPPQAILFSDGSFAGVGAGGKADGIGGAASGVRLRFERIGPEERGGEEAGADEVGAAGGAGADNTGIVGIAARRDAEDPAMVRVFVDVLNARSARATAVLTLSFAGAVVERRALEVPARAAASGVAGRATATFEVRETAGGVLETRLGGGDALAADDAAALVLAPAAAPAVRLVRREAEASGVGLTAATLLGDVLAELRTRSVETVTAAAYEQRAAEGGLAPVDLTIFDRVTPSALPPGPTLSFGAAPPLPGVVGLGAAKAGGAATGVLFWTRAHPLLRNVSLDALVVAETMPLRIDPGAAGAWGVSTLARGRAGPLIVLAEGPAARHIVVAFELGRSNWPLQATFPVFLADALDYLTLRGEAADARSFTTAQAARVLLRPGAARPAWLTLRGPELAEVPVPPEGAGTTPTVALGVLERAGVYAIEGEATVELAVAVNLVDETESTLASPALLEVAGRAVPGVAGGPARREVWAWFVMAAGALLLVEWVVYAWRVRA